MAANIYEFGIPLPDVVTQVLISKVGGIVANRFIISTGADYAGASDIVAGVSMFASPAGDYVSCNRGPVAMVSCSAAIAQFAEVEISSNGQIQTHSAATVRGVALQAAGASGDVIPVQLAVA